MNSKVYLVGAGCAGPSFLSVRALELLQRADVVVYDALVDPAILQLAARAVQITKGKRAHQPSSLQSDIHESLFALTKTYRCIVRLQGGDPMVFGRGMEEVAFLRARGIDVEVVPGISSLLGLPALESFGLTKRGRADGFLVVTASSADKPRSAKAWKTIADFEGTVVFFMGMNRLDNIRRELIAAGKSPATPCVVMTSLSPGHIRSAKTDLDALETCAKENHLYSPGLVLVGGTAADFRPEKRPLVYLTSSDALNKKIRDALPGTIQYDKVLEMVYEDYDLPASVFAGGFPDWIVLTSRHGVDALFAQFQKLGIDLRHLAGTRFALIGKSSAKALESHGLFADLVASNPDSASLLENLQSVLTPGDTVLLAQSKQAIPALGNGLRQMESIALLQIPLYSLSCRPCAFSWLPACAQSDSALQSLLQADALVLASRTAAKAALKEDLIARTKAVVTISEDVAQIIGLKASETGTNVIVASQPDAAGITRTLQSILQTGEPSE